MIDVVLLYRWYAITTFWHISSAGSFPIYVWEFTRALLRSVEGLLLPSVVSLSLSLEHDRDNEEGASGYGGAEWEGDEDDDEEGYKPVGAGVIRAVWPRAQRIHNGANQ